jgi:hypothetical protein
MTPGEFIQTLFNDVELSFFGKLIVGAVYFVGAIILWGLWRLLRPLRAFRWLVLLPLAIVIIVWPLADEVAITREFKLACKDAGVHVVRQVEVDGFFDAVVGGGYENIDRHGYSFMEQQSERKEKIEHIQRVDRKWQVTILDRPTARYHYKFADPRQEVPYGKWVQKRETQVIDTKTGEVIATETRFNRYSSPIQLLWPVQQCPDPGKFHGVLPLPESALIPRKK